MMLSFADRSGGEEPFKVVLVFHLLPDSADEEMRRSLEPDSFPSQLARQPGFVGMELVKVSEDRTMSLQTWRGPGDWWAALDAVKRAASERADDKPSILVSRDFFAGTVIREIAGHGGPPGVPH